MRIDWKALTVVFFLSLPAAGPPAPKSPRFRVGVCAHFSQGKAYLPGNLALIRQAGIVSIRDEANWRSVEREKGRLEMPPMHEEYIDAAVKGGFDPMIILDYSNSFYDNGDKLL